MSYRIVMFCCVVICALVFWMFRVLLKNSESVCKSNSGSQEYVSNTLR